ncbi:hypothetical protein M378DRAFT_161892 [Amanita muscaria Koide BX008]|uniref:Uncharacterized protein n=1 Tax=Amanita muscaria (strain Koide BX008) TaxID=946122 RepID=A0A0C2WV10_AMAMK|nr:hypothetical protein M378DRAFT_161892 [Amanita muscaria Koide BX008]
MDSQTPSPAAPERPDPLTATFHNATIDKAERNEFSNTGRDTFKFVLNYNHNSRSAVPTGAGQAIEHPVLEFHDAINNLLNVVPLFVEEVHKNDQSRSTVDATIAKDSSDPVSQTVTTDHTPHSSILENPVDVIDIVPPEPSLLPVANVADRYTRSMLKCLCGYPLYNPKPYCELSKEYPRNGVNVGDVGFVRGSGTFDFLFNICPSQNGLINPPNLPDGFSLETPDHSGITVLEPLLPDTCLFHNPITRTRSGEYICEGPEGAILELPKGAIQDEATNTRPFEQLAARHGVQWYEYTMNRGRSISNGSLYLITSFTKCSQWGIAVFDRPCASGQGLKFDKKRSLPFGKPTSKYHWKGSRTFHTKVSVPDQGNAANQCVFVRGYKIMIRQDIFDNLCKDQPRSDSAIPSSSSQAGSSSMTRQRATRIRGGGGPDPGLLSPMKSDEEVVLHPNFNSSLVHPSDIINATILSKVDRDFVTKG